MKWNESKGYMSYHKSLGIVKSRLGLVTIDFEPGKELMPYYTYILGWLSEKLIELGEKTSIKDRIEEVQKLESWGSEKIISLAQRDLLRSLGISDAKDYVEGERIPYEPDRFVYTWASFFAYLLKQIRIQYQHLLGQKPNYDCPCEPANCKGGYTRGQTHHDYESWVSGVYPEDEAYTWVGSNPYWRRTAECPECKDD